MRQVKNVSRLDDQQTALLTAKLSVPIAVSEVLLENRNLTEDEILALHQMVSDMEPDSALLAMALSIVEIGQFQGTRKTPLMGTLTLQARQYVSEYAPLWLENSQNTGTELDQGVVYDLLSTLPEDLEALNEMLVIVLSSSAIDEKTKQFLRVFQIQSNAHKLIAEALIEEFDAMNRYADILPSFEEIESAYNQKAQTEALNYEQEGNIVSFPTQH